MMTEEILVETLDELSPEDFDQFKLLLHTEGLSFITSERLKEANTEDVVKLLLELNRKDCVEETRKVLLKMERTDLVPRLSKIDSRAKEQQQIPLSHRVELMVSVTELLLETLADLTDIQLRDFHHHLSVIHRLRYDYRFSLMQHYTDLQDTVFTLVQSFGQQSVEVTMEVLQKMEMNDLMKRLIDSSSGPTKILLDEHAAQIHKEATLAAIRELLLETLKDLSEQELSKVQWLLQYTCFQKNLPQIPLRESVTGDSAAVVDQMMRTCGQQSLEVIMEVLMDMNRTDLVQRLSETSSGPKGMKENIDATII
ncbi:uncharacterized protein LOC125016083 [Mugil cephalus]|uniref:uncharacterized protein LOC125016083 n=1 Tax=Mugil cephalus TaxID=48193 RepID=UPI001FB7A2F5|nr:uncharacterized protein LOC125016083 [Mugil cephalus]